MFPTHRLEKTPKRKNSTEAMPFDVEGLKSLPIST
jgi:hypothetical protein